MLPAPMLQPMLAAGCGHTITCASCPLWSSVRGCARGPASMHCIHGKRVRHDRGGREVHRRCSCADLPDAKAFGASPGRLQHETCSTASEGPCGRCICAKSRHARAVRQHDRHGIQLGGHPLTTCRQPHCCSCWPRACCSRADACASCPGSQHTCPPSMCTLLVRQMLLHQANQHRNIGDGPPDHLSHASLASHGCSASMRAPEHIL